MYSQEIRVGLSFKNQTNHPDFAVINIAAVNQISNFDKSEFIIVSE